MARIDHTFAAIVLSLLTVVGAGGAQAAQSGPDFLVNTAADHDDGSCDLLDSGDCTLREAINAANALVGADTIRFQILDMGSSCSSDNVCTIQLVPPLGSMPAINDDLTIDASVNDAAITIDGFQKFIRAFVINSGKIVTFRKLTIANAGRIQANGGAIINNGTLYLYDCLLSGNGVDTGAGGAIYNTGTLVVSGSTFSGNTMTNGGGTAAAIHSTSSAVLMISDSTFIANRGDIGAIDNWGQMEIVTTTFNDNQSTAVRNLGGATILRSTFRQNLSDAQGGALANTNTLTIGNSTFVENGTTGGNDRGGGAIWNSGRVTASNCTFFGNYALSPAGGGAIADWSYGVDVPGTLLYNCIIGGSTHGGNCQNIYFSNMIAADPYSLDDDGSCGDATLVDTTSLGLQALASNGGPTQTVALASNSIAIDVGDDAVCSAAPVNGIDQTGHARNIGTHCDVGAYEYREVVPPTPGPNCPATPPLDCKGAETGKGSLSLVRNDDPGKNKLDWKWVRGDLTTVTELGDPTTTTDYSFCLYDGNDALVAAQLIPGGADCDGDPCWKQTSKGFTYKNRSGVPDGIKALTLSIGKGTAGSAKIALKAGGENFDVPGLPLAQAPGAVRALLTNDSTNWCASYSIPAGGKDPANTEKWKDKND